MDFRRRKLVLQATERRFDHIQSLIKQGQHTTNVTIKCGKQSVEAILSLPSAHNAGVIDGVGQITLNPEIAFENIYRELLRAEYGSDATPEDVKPISFIDMQRLGKKYLHKRFAGVYSKSQFLDEQPNNKNKPVGIVNTVDSGMGHWMGFYSSGHRTIIYDSLGRKIYLDGKLVSTEEDAEQDPMDTDCGIRALAWCLLCLRYGPDRAMQI